MGRIGKREQAMKAAKPLDGRQMSPLEFRIAARKVERKQWYIQRELAYRNGLQCTWPYPPVILRANGKERRVIKRTPTLSLPVPTRPDRSIENWLILYRSRASISQEQLAEKVGVSRQTINAIEKSRQSPTLGVALLIAEALNAPVDEIFHLAYCLPRGRRLVPGMPEKL